MKLLPAFYNLAIDDKTPVSTTFSIDELDPNVKVSVVPVFIKRDTEKNTVNEITCKDIGIGVSEVKQKPGEATPNKINYAVNINYSTLKQAITTCAAGQIIGPDLVPALKVIINNSTPLSTESAASINEQLYVPIVLTDRAKLSAEEQGLLDNPRELVVIRNYSCDAQTIFFNRDINCTVEIENTAQIPFTYELNAQADSSLPFFAKSNSTHVASAAFLFPSEKKTITYKIPQDFIQFGQNTLGVRVSYTNQFMAIPLAQQKDYHLLYFSVIVLGISVLLGLSLLAFLGMKLRYKFVSLKHGRAKKARSESNKPV